MILLAAAMRGPIWAAGPQTEPGGPGAPAFFSSVACSCTSEPGAMAERRRRGRRPVTPSRAAAEPEPPASSTASTRHRRAPPHARAAVGDDDGSAVSIAAVATPIAASPTPAPSPLDPSTVANVDDPGASSAFGGWSALTARQQLVSLLGLCFVICNMDKRVAGAVGDRFSVCPLLVLAPSPRTPEPIPVLLPSPPSPRVNLSIAILPMREELGWSPTTAGLVQAG